MVTARDIVIISIHSWEIEGGSNIKDIALEFSKHNRVLFVERPLDRKSKLLNKNTKTVQRILDIRQGKQPGLVKKKENLWVFQPDIIVESINWIGTKFLHRFFNRKNNLRLAKSILKTMNKLDFNDVIVFNDGEMILGFFLDKYINPDLYIYYIRDNLIVNPYWKKHGKYLEPELIKKADLVVSNSVWYADYAKTYNSHSYMIGQGCDLTLFQNKNPNIPLMLKSFEKPIIGYFGFLSSRRLDIELIMFLAKLYQTMNFVLVGNEDNQFKQSRLHHLKNVFFAGSVKSEEAASFIGNFDVCINPQLVSAITNGNYPRKIDEYLAMGKPVVASFTEAMRYFSDTVYLAKTKEEFASMIETALKTDDINKRERRINSAKSHTWERCVELIYGAIEKLEKKKNG